MSHTMLALAVVFASSPAFAAGLRAGAASVDVTPERFPVIVNGSFAEQTATVARDRLHARALVLDNGSTRLVVVVVDTCMMPREFLDKTKGLIHAETSIPVDRQLISATHTHTAPAAMGCLGSDADPTYGEFLQRQIVRSVRQAADRLAPAQVGWAVVPTSGLTHNRRWILRADKVRPDPFGIPTVRANMHPGYQNADFVGESGPVDPFLSLLSVRTVEGTPIAVLANFSMHYFGAAPVSADYFGMFCGKLEQRTNTPGFVAILSQGTSGDQHWMDYARPKSGMTIDRYSDAVVDQAAAGLKGIVHRSDVPLAMAESTLTLGRRTPDSDRQAWAKKRVDALAGKKPTAQPDIYAREAVFLHAEPTRELKLQAVRIGDLGLVALPNEVFGITGLKIKARSPLPVTFNIELANGADGYIPPPHQHVLGGYTTWPARTAGLEVQAEPKITDAAVMLLEQIAGKKRLPDADPTADPYAQLVMAGKPIGYWRLGEWEGRTAADLTGKHPGQYEPGVVFGLDGPVVRNFDGLRAINRAAHFAGGRVLAKIPDLGLHYSVELWFWNGVPGDAREDTGTLVAFGRAAHRTDRGPEVSLIRGKVAEAREVPLRTWRHVVLVRNKDTIQVHTAGLEPVTIAAPEHGMWDTLTIGGRMDGTGLFEGRIAEVAVYDRSLTREEIAERVKAAHSGERNR